MNSDGKISCILELHLDITLIIFNIFRCRSFNSLPLFWYLLLLGRYGRFGPFFVLICKFLRFSIFGSLLILLSLDFCLNCCYFSLLSLQYTVLDILSFLFIKVFEVHDGIYDALKVLR